MNQFGDISPAEFKATMLGTQLGTAGRGRAAPPTVAFQSSVRWQLRYQFRPFFADFPQISQLRTTPTAPWNVLYLASMLIRC